MFSERKTKRFLFVGSEIEGECLMLGGIGLSDKGQSLPVGIPAHGQTRGNITGVATSGLKQLLGFALGDWLEQETGVANGSATDSPAVGRRVASCDRLAIGRFRDRKNQSLPRWIPERRAGSKVVWGGFKDAFGLPGGTGSVMNTPLLPCWKLAVPSEPKVIVRSSRTGRWQPTITRRMHVAALRSVE